MSKNNPNYDNIIIGGGIAGLTILYYLMENTKTRNLLITKSFNSQTNISFPAGPRYLHQSKDTEALLRRLGLSTKTEEIFIGFKSGDEIRNYASDEFREKYAMKSRKTNKVEGSFLSGGKTIFTAYVVTQNQLSLRLLNKCSESSHVVTAKTDRNRMLVSGIKNIDFKKVTTDFDGSFYSSNIISTIPFPSLLKVVSSSSVTFRLSQNPMSKVYYYLLNESGKDVFNYVYSISDSWYRKSYDKDLDKWVFETHEPRLFESEHKEKILDSYSLDSQIVNSLNMKEIGNIKLVGRYAQLNHSIKTEDVIKWAHNYTRKFQDKKDEKN